MTRFIFGLSGTITREEILSRIAGYFNIHEVMPSMVIEKSGGNIPFIESFIRTVHVLGKLPIDEISDLLVETRLCTKVIDFIKKNRENCIITTNSLACWTDKLLRNIGCEYHASDCIIEDNRVKKLTHILQKENVVKEYQNRGERVVFVGNGNNDSEAMRIADISIASGLTKHPTRSVLSVADYLICNEETLCRQLDRLF
jgi:phosphoserine phosphatase